MFQKKVHYVSQLGSMDCGIACLTMILNYYGCKSDIVDIGAEIQIGRDGRRPRNERISRKVWI